MSGFQLSQGRIIIEASPIKIPGTCKMDFTRIGTKPKGRLDSSLSQRQPRRCAIPAIVVNLVVGPGELAICLEKAGVMRDSLVQ